MQENESMTLPDRRTLAYSVYGAPTSQKVVFYFCGFPSSRYEGKHWHSTAEKHGIRLISPDRPGMGKSTFQPNRTLLDWNKDVIALADHLGIQKFYVMGTSGGGPYALASIKGIPKDRLLGVSVVSGLYPTSLGTAGMLLKTRVLLWVAPWFTGLTNFLMDASMGSQARNPDPKVFENLMSGEVDKMHEGDARAIKEEHVWPIYVAMAREAMMQGGEGPAWEAKLYGSDYGFDFGDLDVGEGGIPLTLWHGTTDVNCPVGMATGAKDLMPGAKLRLKEGEGHVSFVFRDTDEILHDLVGSP